MIFSPDPVHENGGEHPRLHLSKGHDFAVRQIP